MNKPIIKLLQEKIETKPIVFVENIEIVQSMLQHILSTSTLQITTEAIFYVEEQNNIPISKSGCKLLNSTDHFYDAVKIVTKSILYN